MMFVHVGDQLLNVDEISRVDLTDLRKLSVTITTKKGKRIRLRGIATIDLMMTLKPSALEGQRLRWVRHSWAIHNLIGHPLMQLAAWFKLYKLAMYIHETTVPRPRNSKPSRR